MRLQFFVFCVCCCLLLWGSFFRDLGVILMSCLSMLVSLWRFFCQFWCHFGVLGGLLGTPGLPRGPQRGRVEKVMKKLVRGSSPGGSKFQQNPTKFDKKSLQGARWKVLVARCCTRGAAGPLPTVKTMVSCTRNHRFHSSTWRPKTTENGVQWVPFGTL